MLKPKFVELQSIKVLCVRKEGAYDKSAKEAWEVLMGFAYQNQIKYPNLPIFFSKSSIFRNFRGIMGILVSTIFMSLIYYSV